MNDHSRYRAKIQGPPAPPFDFRDRFPDNDSCLAHLAVLKLGNGYKCPKCSHSRNCKGVSPLSRQCSRSNYTEFPTAGTLFHKAKLVLLKAFYIVYFVSANKKDITFTELSSKLVLRQKTRWKFKRKVMKAMKSLSKYPITGTAEVDETVFGEQGVRDRKNKKLVVITIEKKGKG